MKKINIFITGESGVIPMAIQNILRDSKKYNIVNDQIKDEFFLNQLKKHKSFEIRKPELDFLDFNLFKDLSIFKNIDIIIHSGAYVGTDYCYQYPNQAISTNVQGTKNIVDICNMFNIKLIYFSTTAIFDVDDYSESKPITEKTNISPKTLYGITKYSGEIISKKLCKQPTLIVRPVFGFGDFPHDLHSALTKIIFTHIYNNNIGKHKKLEVLLNFNIKKSYTRVENIAYSIINLLNFENNDEINIGESYLDSKNWYEIFDIIENKLLKYNITTNIKSNKNIIFKPDYDYLHFHNIDNTKMKKMNIEMSANNNYITFDEGVENTVKSVIENQDIIPYWL